MKPIKLLLITLALFTLTAISTKGEDWGDNKSKSFKISKGGSLVVELHVGEIIIQTWDKDEVEMTVSGISDNAFKSIESSIRGNQLTINYENDYDDDESEDVTFRFSVPSTFNLDLRTMAGEIKLKNNITGNVTIDTYGGDIKAMNINGNVKLETKGGDIKLQDVTGDCNIYTYGGEITVGSVNGKNVKVSTNGGDIKIAKSSTGVIAKTYGGEISVGDLGGDSELVTYGGDVKAGFVKGNVKMETYGGNLELNGAKGKVRGKTNGGDVRFRKIEGSVELKTMAGVVSVELNPSANSESKISTSSGSIELIVPSSAKTTIDARIHVQGWWKEAKETLKIESDFIEISSALNDNKKEITAKYELNGGGSVIYLRSVNDVISIKKSK